MSRVPTPYGPVGDRAMREMGYDRVRTTEGKRIFAYVHGPPLCDEPTLIFTVRNLMLRVNDAGVYVNLAR